MICRRYASGILLLLLLLPIITFWFSSFGTEGENVNIVSVLELLRIKGSDYYRGINSSYNCTYNNITPNSESESGSDSSAIPGLLPWRISMGERDSSRYKDYIVKCPSIHQPGAPFLFKNYRTGKKAIICLTAKTGSTTWKQLLGEGLGLNAAGKMVRRDRITVKPEARKALKYYESLSIQEIMIGSPCRESREALADPAVKRFMFVKNPYARFLSGYLDKVEGKRNPLPKFLPTGFHKGLGFSLFANSYLNMQRNKDKINSHFLPISSMCNIPQGMKYDYIFNVEEMHKWYEAFIGYLEIEQEAQHGWNINTRYFQGHRNCFYAPPGKTCEELFVKRNESQNNEINNSRKMGGGIQDQERSASMPKSFHATGSASKLDNYYDERSISLVTDFAKNDLKCFGYPEWSGISGSEYSKKLKTLRDNNE